MSLLDFWSRIVGAASPTTSPESASESVRSVTADNSPDPRSELVQPLLPEPLPPLPFPDEAQPQGVRTQEDREEDRAPIAALRGLSKGLWHVEGSSVCGSSHEQTGAVCQDAHEVAVWPSQSVLVVAVADGAGSARLSHLGSAIAARAAADFLSVRERLRWCEQSSGDDRDWDTLLRDALEEARSRVEEEARVQGVLSRELATTLIVIVATPQVVAAAQIGDGAAVVQDYSGGVALLNRPQTGEYANQTNFLTSSNALKVAEVKIWRGDVAGVAAFSDGLQMLALEFPHAQPHLPFFAPLFTFAHNAALVEQSGNELEAADNETDGPGQLEALLRSARVRERADDDLTLVVAVRAGMAKPRSAKAAVE